MPRSIVIIMRAKNEMPHVERTLQALDQQTFTDFELLAIDSGSTDGTLRALRKQCYNLTQIKPEEYIPGKVLNEAIAQTQHDIIVLLNADAVPKSSEWLAHLLHPILNGSADATYSRQMARPNARFIVDYDYQRAFAPEKPTNHFFSAAACAFRRELWEQHKFHENGYAEDAIWASTCRMLNARFLLTPESEVEHSHNYSIKELFRKKHRHGYSFANVLGEFSPLGHRLYLCGKELLRDLFFTLRKRQFSTIPYNLAYRITIHAGLHKGLRDGTP